MATRKITDQDLQKKYAELERKNEEITSFAFVASHDLKEPIRKLYTFTDLINSRENLSEAGRKNVSRMYKCINRLDSLIEDILALSKIGANNESNQIVALNDVLQRVKDDLEDWIEERGATFELSDLPPIEGDRSQLAQVFLNLVKNALQAMNGGGGLTLTTRMETDFHIREPGREPGQFIWVEIADTGAGIPEEHLAHIFSPFFTTKSGGTGLGLAISYRIVREHGGLIRVESRPGEGTTFKISLRIAG